MGVAYYVSFENGDDDVCTATNGKTLARAEKQLNKVAKTLGLKKLEDYFGASEDVLEEFGVDEGTPGPWFEPDEGLQWFDAMISHLKANPSAIKDSEDVLEELTDFRAVMAKAKEAGTKWCFCLDV